MNINSLLKKEGLDNIRVLDEKEVNTIAKDISIKLCLAFPEYNLNRSDLFDTFCTLKMYNATMPKDSSGAKYLSINNSIYFNENLQFEDIPDVAMHECLHFIQNNNIHGVSEFTTDLALNEAAIQLMASEANMCDVTEERYFNICLKTTSPIYYPLECAIVKQMVYFTGTYPLYYSVLNYNNIFKSTFITKFNSKIYKTIVKKLQILLDLENELNFFASELEYVDKIRSIKQLNYLIDSKKKEISKVFYDTQNFIIKNCFNYEFNNIRTSDNLYEFKQLLYGFKNIIGYCENYTFYNDFYRDIMNALEIRKAQIEHFGEISLFKEYSTSLTIVDNTKNVFSFAKTLLNKLAKLLKSAKDKILE